MTEVPRRTARVTTVALADDHQVVRQGVRALLTAEHDLLVVAEASDGLEALRVVERVKPQVLVLDLMMPVMSGRDVIGQVVQRFPATRVVVLSMHASEAYVLDALRSGALAYVLKESSAQDLVAAVRAAAAGRRYLGSGLSEHAIAAYVERTKGAPLDPYDTLTPREREVLRLTAEGESSAAIAARLAISPRTVETHRANLMRKLGLRAHGDVIRYALKRRIVPLE